MSDNTETKLTPYKKILTMGKEAIDAALAHVRARSAKKKAELEMAQLDERIATLEADINNICAEKELDFNKLLAKLDDIAIAKRRLRQFEEIVAQLFPEE